MSSSTSDGPTIPSDPPRQRKHPDAHCEDCGLYDGAYASGTGPSGAHLAIVGEAPGYKEARDGVAFSGPSGQLLNQVLEHHGISRSEAYVDNVCACRPSDNRTPTASEIKACLPRLLAELDARPIDTIVTLGNTSTQTLLQTGEGITSVRVGPPKHVTLPGADEEVRVIPTFHPAACLYAPDNFPHLVSDLGKVNGSTVVVGWEPPAYKVFDAPREAAAALDELCQRFDEFVIDIEVGIDKDIDFDHPERYQFLCIGIGYARGKVAVLGEGVLGDGEVRQKVRRLLETKRLVCHNGKFDLAGLTVFGQGRLHFDTMLASYVLDERPGTHGLKYLAAELLGAPDWDSELQKYRGKGDSYAVVPRPVLYKYNAMDVHCTWMLKELYEEQMDEEARKLHDFLVEAANELMHLEMEGLCVDVPYLDRLTDEYLVSIEELKGPLRDLVGRRDFNPNSPQQVKAYLHEEGFKVQSTDADNLELLIRKTKKGDNGVGDFVRQLLLHRREAKLYGTYVKGTRKRLYQGRVHPTFLLHGTVTGRLACRNPNLHNVPRESRIRQQFVPAEGNVFIQGDYPTIELRVMAAEANDPTLGTIFREGRDIHNEFSRIFYGDDFTKDQRVRTKAFVYGTAYGREAYSIAMEYDIPVEEAQRNQDALFQSMPGVSAWREAIKNRILHEGEDLVTRFGRRRRFHLITNTNSKDVVKEGLAFVPQSTASDICLKALIRLRRDHGLHIRVPVHDSILVECARDDADQVGRLVSEVMEAEALEHLDGIPCPVDVNIGTNWGEV